VAKLSFVTDLEENMQNVVTEKHTGIVHDYNHEKYGDVRHKAMNEYIERKNKARKDKTVKVPKYHPGQIVLACEQGSGGKKKCYMVYEIVDFRHEVYRHEFTYFGILLKATDHKMLERVGRLDSVNETVWYFSSHKHIIEEYNEKTDSIKWL
jgi:hypothetical protein